MRILSYVHACDHTHMRAFRHTYRGHFEISWCHQTNDPNMTEVAIQKFTVYKYSLLGTSEDVKPSQCSLKLEPWDALACIIMCQCCLLPFTAVYWAVVVRHTLLALLYHITWQVSGEGVYSAA